MDVDNNSTPLRDQRLRLGLTLRELAARCAAEGTPVDFSQLARIEKGMCVPRPRVRAVLAKVLDIDAATDFERVPR